MGKTVLLWVFIVIALSFPFGLLQSEEDQKTIAPGELISKVSCKDKPQYSYACYLPKNYTPKGKWPILYCFSPGADGPGYVGLFHGACEEAGWIIVGSNDSTNGPVQTEAIQSMWQDTQKRFSVDTDAVYVSGWSGGSRVATMFSVEFKAAGHIANGGVFPSGGFNLPKIAYWLMCGEKDFNRSEMERAEKQVKDMKCPVTLKLFPGEHNMPPQEVAHESVKWMNGVRLKVLMKKFPCDMKKKEKMAVCADCNKILNGYQCQDCKKKFVPENETDKKCPGCGGKKLSPAKLVEQDKCFFCQSANIKEEQMCIKEVYACPDHPDETSAKTGKCSQCKKALEFKEKSYSKIISYYECPKCEFTQEKPGKCPNCKETPPLQKQTRCEMSGTFPHTNKK
ncbi:MAG: heavy metal-binding domain-containing protein [Planctomycetota bacterium]